MDHARARVLRRPAGRAVPAHQGGAPLPPRALDPRIAAVLERIRANPSAAASAHDCAAQAGLSFSRFLHLFKQDVGIPFRSLRSWKRARALLHHVHRGTPLVDVALDIGYPDSTHFSHSIRQTYGLKPRDIVAGSKKLRIIGQLPAAASAHVIAGLTRHDGG